MITFCAVAAAVVVVSVGWLISVSVEGVSKTNSI